MSAEVLVELHPSPGRRIFSAMTMGMLAAILIYLSLLIAPDFLLSALFLLAGLATGWLAWWQFQSSATVIELTREVLATREGDVLARVQDIERVERGVFAMKPSQGFLLRLVDPQPRAYVPGVYWRIGRRLGIGGITNSGQAKAMAQTLEALIAEREA
ncbi:MAG: hypothetical protein AAFQ54_05930 [Pseudomonadota bacterium]